ncbi:MAG: hypothetical protein AB1546_09225, partial [bacterium]
MHHALRTIIFISFFPLLIFHISAAAQQEADILRVQVDLTFTDTNIPSIIQERIKNSMQQVGERAL